MCFTEFMLNTFIFPNFIAHDAKIPNSKGIGHVPKMVKNNPDLSKK